MTSIRYRADHKSGWWRVRTGTFEGNASNGYGPQQRGSSLIGIAQRTACRCTVGVRICSTVENTRRAGARDHENRRIESNRIMGEKSETNGKALAMKAEKRKKNKRKKRMNESESQLGLD